MRTILLRWIFLFLLVQQTNLLMAQQTNNIQEIKNEIDRESASTNGESGNASAMFYFHCAFDVLLVRQTNSIQRAEYEATERKAEADDATAKFNLGDAYGQLQRYLTTNDLKSQLEITKSKAEAGDAIAQYYLGRIYENHQGVAKDYVEAFKWYQKAAKQGLAEAQFFLGDCYTWGHGTEEHDVEAADWIRKAAEQGYYIAQKLHATDCEYGSGVPKNYFEAYKWFTIASAQAPDYDNLKPILNAIKRFMTAEQIAQAKQLASEFKPRRALETGKVVSAETIFNSSPSAFGTGFFITDDGYFVTNWHVIEDAGQVRLVTSAGIVYAKVLLVNETNDLALLKADGRFAPLPISSSKSAHLGGTVATIGFPDPTLQGFSPKLAKGEIASLSGAADDPRYFQISVPVQPGNSGGALVDERGNVIGIVSAKLDASVALAASGALPENVNYAVKSSLLLSFLESVPDVANKLKATNTADEKFEDVVKSAQDAAVLVLVY